MLTGGVQKVRHCEFWFALRAKGRPVSQGIRWLASLHDRIGNRKAGNRTAGS